VASWLFFYSTLGVPSTSKYWYLAMIWKYLSILE
jgi:hypothetical protein